MTERPTPSAPLLSIADASVTFGGITALDGVSLQVSPGEVLGVIGPNGAGKTTLFNAICGFVQLSSGEIRLRGRPLQRVRPDRLARLGVARTLQGVGLFSRLSALENVMVGADRFRRTRVPSALLGLPWSDRDERRLRERAVAALERVGCGGVSDRLPGTLPYAVQKQIALARALVSDADLVLLDEPAGGLGTAEMKDLAALVRSLGRDIAVMLVDHNMDFVTSVCHRVVVLDFGRVIATGAPAEIRRDVAVLEAYLGREAELQEAPTVAGDA